MIKIKRLKSLVLLKNKALNIQKKEINTLCEELNKSNSLKDRLENILKETKHNKKAAIWEIRGNNNFCMKLLNQISISKNRIKFLEKELIRSKNNLGNLILQKKEVEKKIKISNKINIEKREQKEINNTPAVKNL